MSDKMDTEARKMYDDAIEVIIIHGVFPYSWTAKPSLILKKKPPNPKNPNQSTPRAGFDYVSFKKSSGE